IETLVAKTKRALIKHKVKTFTLGGGVAANTALRQNLTSVLSQEFPDITYLEPQTQYATDNAAMIAAVGHIILASGKKLSRFAKTDPQWEI
ncbi:MAG TPA: hypothetical protein VEA37_09965, partial [Flavobacterium sp.]|nr:hypothetical protein [Flavobacterium sp.]